MEARSGRIGVVAVKCLRLGCMRTIDEHLSCPYCCGRRAEVAAADRERFCDWQPQRDPVTFGFPSTFGRYGWPVA